ncbi:MULTISPECIES: SusC/RagA family TonB-linked outer membrane protein [Reichenbachiella]|uniref:TonB-linked outer membrane protein, SusC/RagA family n=1 Tax=Reichenbachiella agariperforans TaxID=156994 RepID=A0A1M6R678_REIAG|nr:MULTISPECIES: SusC/RagA family TonB-linked outer membrane protein [Reichenbachiella]SHK27858.1 TonB-linked outer membrane protein, SusC/RagA family [Reichenbachiella agariperforans]
MKRILLICFMLLSALVTESWAQDRTVSGKVTDDTGEGLPGVNVVLKGTTVGSTSDIEGNWKVSVPSDGGVLVFSFVGMTAQEVAIGSRSVIDITMKADAQQLSELVITSYGIARAKDELTYATQKIESKDLVAAEQPQAGIGLVGKVAGMQVNVQNNGVKPDVQIVLRGLNSISKSNAALIVIDGIIATSSAFGDLNPHDIESINVLKGANAAALYGADAVNGALIVTTKRGTGNADKFTVGINTSVTFEEVAYMPDFQSEYGIGWDGHYDPIENTNWGPRYDGVTRQIGPTFPDGYVLETQEVPYAPIQDNLLDFYDRGVTNMNTVYAAGGDETGSFYMSFGNQTTTGIVPDDEFERTTFRVNATKQIGKLKLGVYGGYYQDKTNVVGDQIGDQDRPLYWFILNTQSNIPLTSYKDYDNPASYGYADNYYNAYYQNPYWAIGTNRDEDKTSRLYSVMSASYDILDNLKFVGNVGVNSRQGSGKNHRDRQEYSDELQPAHSTVSSFVEDFEFTDVRYNGNFTFQGSFDIGETFNITPIVGMSFKNDTYRESTIRSNNLSIPGFYDVNSGVIGSTDVDEWTKRQIGVFADVTFGYDNWVFLNATGRQDWTSTLPLDDNTYFYPSVGLSVVLTEGISALKDNDILSYAKLSVSNATVYNDLPVFLINETYRQQNTRDLTGGFENYPAFPLAGQNGYYLSTTTVDANISKEKLNTTEFGATLGFLRGRINLDGAYFITTTTDLITGTTPSRASGASYFYTNIGELQTKGLELALGATILEIGDFSWKANINYTSYESVVKEIKEGLDEIGLDVYTAGYGTYAVKGEAFPQIKAAGYLRNDNGQVIIDSNGNPQVGDVISQGKTTPDYILGGTSRFEYKGLSLSATMDYRTGHVYYEQGSDAMEFTGRSVASVSSNRQDFVWPNSVIDNGDGTYTDNTNIPITGGVMGFWKDRYNEIKENYVKDATALKLREVTLRYAIPSDILEKTKVISRMSVGVFGRNLVTWLPEENRFSDPEFKNTRATDDANGVGIGGYFTSPPTRTYGFNLNIEF